MSTSVPVFGVAARAVIGLATLVARLLVHLLPTATAVVLAIRFVFDPSWTTFGHYFGAAFLCGFALGFGQLISDHTTLLHLGRAVRHLNLIDVEFEDHNQLLPERALNYFHRFLKRDGRKPLCFLVNSKNPTIESPRAFAFRMSCSVCIHSLGSVSKQPKSKNIILYHEVGHLFVHQARGGYLVLLFGNAIPLLFIAIYYGITDVEIDLALMISALALILALDLFMMKSVDKKQRETNADSFALACWFTEHCDGWSIGELETTLHRGHFFEEMPALLRAYCDWGPASISDRRKRAFRRSYERMNRVGWLNWFYLRAEKATGDRGGYWREIFFRHTLSGYFVNTRSVLTFLRLGAVIFFSFHILHAEISWHLFLLLAACAAGSTACMFVSASRLDRDKRFLEGDTSIRVIKSEVYLNRVKHG